MSEEVLISKLVQAKEFYAVVDSSRKKYALPDALEACQKEHEAQFMPTIIDTKINSPGEARIWQVLWTTPSIRATGRTKQGNPVVVYAHIHSYFSNPKNIRIAIKQGLRIGAGKMPQLEFQKLVDLDEATDEQGNRVVWVVDYDKLKNSASGIMPLNTDSDLEQVLEHPQIIPFVGGKARAEDYLKKHKQVYGEQIGNWHSDDLADEPQGRILLVGYNDYYSLVGDSSLYGIARFAGISRSVFGTSQKIIVPKQNISSST